MGPKIKVEIEHTGKVVYSSTFTQFPVVIGRNPECQIKLDQFTFISRVHGSIAVKNDEIIVTDLGSRNGIRSNGKKVHTAKATGNLNFTIEDLGVSVRFLERGKIDHEETEITVLDGRTLTHQKVGEGVRFSIAPQPHIRETPIAQVVLQAVITWDYDIYDVRNFSFGEPIIIGPSEAEPIYIPIVQGRQSFGSFEPKGAAIRLLASAKWQLYRDKVPIPVETLVAENRIEKQGQHVIVRPGIEDVISQNLPADLAVHFRYVKAPIFRMKRSFIENREEFKKAAIASIGVHLLVCLIAVLVAPRSKGPKIDNVPPRIAKLLVEPPSQILAAKPPEPPPPPPEPEPEPEPPPPPPEPKKAEAPKPIEKPKKIPPQKRPKAQAKAVANPKPVKEVAPAPSAQDQVADLLKALPGPPAGGSVNTGAPIQIAQKDIAPTGVRVAGVAAPAGQASPSPGTADTSFKIGQAGPQGYAKGKGGKAGTRNIEGKVIGTPSLAPDFGSGQGLSNDEVMKIVNQHLGAVQRCYERALFEDGSISGRVEYEWEISPAGKVSDIKVRRSQIASADTLNNCVFEVFRKMKFPVAKNGQSTIAKIGFPFGK